MKSRDSSGPDQLTAKMLPALFCTVFLLLFTSGPGHSNEIDTQQCFKDKGTCHPTICPTQKMSKGTCYHGQQLCCVDCPTFFLSYEGNGAFPQPKFGLSDSIKVLLGPCFGKGTKKKK